MGKARLSVNDDEARIVELARRISKLKARRRRTLDELTAIDHEIEGTTKALGEQTAMTGGAHLSPVGSASGMQEA